MLIHESCIARIRNQRFNLSMSIDRTAEVEDDGLMPMATGYEESGNKPFHTRFAYSRKIIAFRRGQIAWIPILTECKQCSANLHSITTKMRNKTEYKKKVETRTMSVIWLTPGSSSYCTYREC
jgi:hypothetical protein